MNKILIIACRILVAVNFSNSQYRPFRSGNAFSLCSLTLFSQKVLPAFQKLASATNGSENADQSIVGQKCKPEFMCSLHM